jgi:dTDP-4-amino-4,6-dideoxygalactose transaminase
MENIPFNKPWLTGNEFQYVKIAHEKGKFSGDGYFTNKCQEFLADVSGSQQVLLTHSCTASLEMAALLSRIKPGDEVILPSFTFVSTANAFILRGAKLVFCDIRSDTQNIDESLIPNLITSKTKAIVPVHYAGVSCDMDPVLDIAKSISAYVIEDAAQAIGSRYKNTTLGSIGSLGTLSFHETKNISCGEGGALLINDCEMIQRAEIIRDKGTNRKQFFRGEVDKYTWVDIGSSYLPNEITAAFLWAQLEKMDEIILKRQKIWWEYHRFFKPFEEAGLLSRPVVPDYCTHNAHIYYIKFGTGYQRDQFIKELKKYYIHSVFHYVPLHSTGMGYKYSGEKFNLPITDETSATLARLPLWPGIEHRFSDILDKITTVLGKIR